MRFTHIGEGNGFTSSTDSNPNLIENIFIDALRISEYPEAPSS